MEICGEIQEEKLKMPEALHLCCIIGFRDNKYCAIIPIEIPIENFKSQLCLTTRFVWIS
jgi:hypothetical protein